LAANHTSHLDTVVLLAALPWHLRLRTRVAAAADYFFTCWWRGILVKLLLNAFAFERRGPGCATSLLRARQFLAGGQSLVIFPEGTRAKDGQIQRFKKGVGKLALATGAQVIPIWIDGTYAALPKGARWPRRQRITIRFGTPLTFAGETDPLSVAAAIERQVRALAMQTESASSHQCIP
jgi:1-acyl-sn-glycerol-3-phosphate acyltransferase